MIAPLVALTLLAAGPNPASWDRVRSLPADCPIVYDNDWLGDTNDDEYLFARAHLGRAKLKGIVLTRDQWGHGKQFTLEDGLKSFREDLEIVRKSGFRNIPELTVGVERMLARPESGRIEDTRPVASPGTDLIVREARAATPEKPLVVIVGGPLLTVASAYLTDPTIADRMVVFMTDLTGYNGPDPWANYIVATRCALVNFGAQRIWWPQGSEPPCMPPERFAGLPDLPVTREMRRVADGFYKRSRGEKRDRDDGFADGAGLFLLFAPETWKAAKRVRVTGAWSQEDAESGPYHYLDASAIDAPAMTEEFFRTIREALESAKP